MRYRILTSLAAAGTLVLAGGVAEAHDRTLRTTVEAERAIIVEGTTEVTVLGRVSSPRERCVPNREVKIFALFEDGSRELKDVARTSDRGYVATHDDFAGANNALFRVMRANIGRGEHRHICGAARDAFPPAEEEDGAEPGAER